MRRSCHDKSSVFTIKNISSLWSDNQKFIIITSKGMLRPCFYLPTLLVTLSAALVQAAPSGIAVMDIDRLNFPSDIPEYDYILTDKAKLQQLRKQWKEAVDVNMMLMQFLQLNMMKIMFMLDVLILICLFFHINESS
ncbi:uncharacterized protein LOC117791049 isoform X1 [Drosophila innubila]|uniref:uncharacterized protein LOC117791049 isoform X1 n=1 Tax=Drosophila innubila TaxID=198719 RepID=UPI00148CD9E8|nr:uncharacterized protein LOC117791049 isoform X1 [Drosophila innubila]